MNKISIIIIDSITQDVIDDIIEKIGSLAILDVIQKITQGYMLSS